MPSNGFTFTITGPVRIASISPLSGPVGTAVTITGSGFGSTQGSSSVFFNGTQATPTGWSNTQIVVPVPSGATTGLISLRIDGTVYWGPVFTVNPTPNILIISPPSGGVGAIVTINGTNFGSTQGSSTVTFNGTVATPIVWNGQIVAPVPTGATTGPVVVTVGGIPSNGVTFTVTGPVLIAGISPPSGPVGTSVAVTGGGFGLTQGSSAVFFNGTQATPTSWSNTKIVVPVPSGATTGQIFLRINGTIYWGPVFTVLSTPHINTLSPPSGAVGTLVTINGTNFGSAQGASTVTFNGTPATPNSWIDTKIVVPVPNGATTGNVVVTVNGVPSNGVLFTVLLNPHIASLSPTAGGVGTAVTISGTNFGSTQGGSTVSFNGTAAIPLSWSGTSILAPVPAGATTGNVVVTVGGNPSNGVSFTVTAAPGLSVLSPVFGGPGTVVTITGAGFGSTQGSSSVTFNGTAATPTNWVAGQIVAPVPAGASTGNVAVTVNALQSNGLLFTTGSPIILNLSPPSGAVGDLIGIIGTGFGSAQGNSTVTFGGTVIPAYSWGSDGTIITIQVPSWAVAGQVPVQVTVNGIASNIKQLAVTPAITSPGLQPSLGPALMGFIINGAGFGTTPGTVTVNGTQWPLVPVSGSWTDTAIMVQVPSSGGTSGVVLVTVNGQTSNNNYTFTVDPYFGCN
jgi:hypothetical protein